MLGGVVLQPLGPLLGPEMQLEGIKKRNQKRDPKIIKKTVLKWDPKMLQKSVQERSFLGSLFETPSGPLQGAGFRSIRRTSLETSVPAKQKLSPPSS